MVELLVAKLLEINPKFSSDVVFSAMEETLTKGKGSIGEILMFLNKHKFNRVEVLLAAKFQDYHSYLKNLTHNFSISKSATPTTCE